MSSFRRRSSFRGHSSYGTASAVYYAREERRLAAARAAQSAALTDILRPPTQEEINRHIEAGNKSESATPNQG